MQLSPLVLACGLLAGAAGPAAAQTIITTTPLRTPKPFSDERPGLSPEEREILSHLSIVYVDDGQGGQVKTLDISGINVRIHNGSGTTAGAPDGLGNLIIGYNELRGKGNDDRTGSHNLVLGSEQNFASHGGILAGRRNAIASTAPHSSVSGGLRNVASGAYASISGGYGNTASGYAASMSGGT